MLLKSTVRKVKVALISRYFFDNWYALLIKYLLAKYVLARFGFSIKLKMKISDYTNEVNPEVFERLIRRIFSRYVHDWKYDTLYGCWVRGNVKFKYWHNNILQIFDYGHWDGLDVEGKVVVDIGAFIGDSSIYFALRGAKKVIAVIAVESHPETYKKMVENIRLNDLEDVIIPVNAGLASSSGICIEDEDVNRTGGAYYRLGECVKVVPAVTLADIRERFNIGHEAVLKMDCEGCEFDVILNDYENVKMFKELVFEYHLHMFDRLLSKLQEVLTKDYYCRTVKEHSKNLGIIYCRRMS